MTMRGADSVTLTRKADVRMYALLHERLCLPRTDFLRTKAARMVVKLCVRIPSRKVSRGGIRSVGFRNRILVVKKWVYVYVYVYISCGQRGDVMETVLGACEVRKLHCMS